MFDFAARAPSSLISSRARPYGDPYSEDALSVLSDWSMDEDMRKLIYGDGDTLDQYTVSGLPFYPLLLICRQICGVGEGKRRGMVRWQIHDEYVCHFPCLLLTWCENLWDWEGNGEGW